jgi:hypothetical protein
MSYRFVDRFRAGPDDGQKNCPKHVEFHAGVIWEIGATVWFYYKEI